MNRLAILIGLTAYCFFFLGILGWLYEPIILAVICLFAISVIFLAKKHISYPKIMSNSIKNNWLSIILIGLFVLQALINLIGALGPEIGFDALWYHLTLPKVYLLQHQIIHIPGGLLYYSDMPKLMELLYLPALAFASEVGAKLIQYSFGILVSVILYQFSKTLMRPKFALLAALIFYTNLVVGWESTSAYIDLGRTFFELLALVSFSKWHRTKSCGSLLLSALFVGLAITTKLLALGSLAIFLLLIIFCHPELISGSPSKNEMPKYPKGNTPAQRGGAVRHNKKLEWYGISRLCSKNKYVNLFSILLVYLFVALLIPLPWFIFSYLHTGNPVYPFFTQTYAVSANGNLFNPIFFFQNIISIFLLSSDPISPLYLIFIPAVIVCYSKFSSQLKLITLYSLLGIIIWYVTPQTGGGRFIIPYLPAFSLLCAAVIEQFASLKQKIFYKIGMIAVIVVALVSIGYRFAANIKYIPVIIGQESRQSFLAKHLNFHYGDFADIDGYFASHIKPTDTVLLFGFHNLYYVDFPFVDSTWMNEKDHFNYIAVQNSKLPKQYLHWHLIYQNPTTLVQLYTLSTKTQK